MLTIAMPENYQIQLDLLHKWKLLLLLLCCFTDSLANTGQSMVVLATVEQWLSLKALLQDSSGDDHLQFTYRSLGSNQVCDFTVDGHSFRLHYADLKQDMAEECTCQALDGCFKSCKDGLCTFLLLIQGGNYSKSEKRLIEMLQAHFGAEALKYLAVLSLENGTAADTLDDALLDLINTCDGRYCRITSSAAGNGLCTLLEIVDYMLTEYGVTGYTDTMLAKARKRSTEDLSMKMLKQKAQEAEEKEQAFRQLVQQQEERRAKEMEELKAKHAEERKKEAAEKKQYETKREGLEEAMISHRATLQTQMSVTGKTYFLVASRAAC